MLQINIVCSSIYCFVSSFHLCIVVVLESCTREIATTSYAYHFIFRVKLKENGFSQLYR